MRLGRPILAIYAIAASTLAAPTALIAREFSCSSKNNTCFIYDRTIVTGDKIGFFTERGELVATGKVTKMSGNRRSVQLQQVSGSVDSQADTYAMITDPTAISQEKFKVYRQPTPIAVGAQVNLASFGAGGDAKGYEATGEMLRRKFLGKVDGFARGSLYSFTGTAENTNDIAPQKTFTATAISAMGGVGYTLFSQSDFFIRSELGAGLSYTMAKIDGSAGDAKSEDWGYQVNSGFAPHLRGLIAAGYSIDRWQIEAGFAPAMLAGKTTTAIGAGLLLNLK